MTIITKPTNPKFLLVRLEFHVDKIFDLKRGDLFEYIDSHEKVIATYLGAKGDLQIGFTQQLAKIEVMCFAKNEKLSLAVYGLPPPTDENLEVLKKELKRDAFQTKNWFQIQKISKEE